MRRRTGNAYITLRRSNHANWVIVNETDDAITLRDIGPHSSHPTITNDAEHVVRTLHDDLPQGLHGKHLYYYDSNGQLDEILHRNGQFTGFTPGPR